MTTYCEDLSIALEEEMFEAYRQDFFTCMDEVEYLAEGYARGFIAMEDVTIDKEKNKSGTFQAIIDFIKRVIAKFMDTCKRIVQNDDKWFNENSRKFDKIPDSVYNAMKVTIVPYWDCKGYKVEEPRIKPDDNRVGTEGYKSTEDLAKQMYPNLIKLTVSGKVSEGAKIFYRGGTNNVKELSGGEVKTRVKAMVDWCRKYAQTCDAIRQEIEEIEKGVQAASDNAQKVLDRDAKDYDEKTGSYNKPTEENFILCENLPLVESTIAYVSFVNNGEVVTEAIAGNVGTKPGSNGPGQDKPPASPNGSVTIDGDKDKPAEPAGPTKGQQEAKERNYSNASAIKSYWQVKLQVGTAMMTIAEERHNAYMRTLRDVLSAGLNTSNNAENKKA